MKTLGHDEFFRNVNAFLRSRGIELTEGTYTRRLRRACGLLTDALNAAQRTAQRARHEVDRRWTHLRRALHEATSPAAPDPSPTRKQARQTRRRPASPPPAKPKRSPRRPAARRPRPPTP